MHTIKLKIIFYKSVLLCSIILFFRINVFCQNSKIVDTKDKIIEQYLQFSNSESLERNDFVFEIENLIQKPIPIHRLNQSTIKSLFFIPAKDQLALLKHLDKNGTFISIYELQAVSGLTAETLDILKLITKNSPNSNKISQTFKEGSFKNSSYLFSTFPEIIGIKENKYLGSPLRIYNRFQYTLPSYYSVGFNLEQDIGEPIKNNGIDHKGFHLFVEEISPTIHKIALGDYKIRFGQGLIINDGFGATKSSYLSSIKTNNKKLTPHTSSAEYNFQRGIASQVSISESLQLISFVSLRQLDASIKEGENENFITNINSAETHRTTTEIANKNNISRFLTGGSINHNSKKGDLALNVLYSQTNIPFGAENIYQTNRIQGRRQTFLSLDYDYRFDNINVYGEVAVDKNMNKAIYNGLLMTLGSKVDLYALYRNYENGFHAVWGNTVRENSIIGDEEGFLLGLTFRAFPNLQIHGYIDQWKHKHFRFGIDAPSNGNEWLARMELNERKAWGVNFQIRQERKLVSATNIQNIRTTTPRRRTNYRIHYQKFVNSNSEYRIRGEFSSYKTIDESEYGFLFYGEYIWNSSRFPLKLASRLTYFNVQDFDARIYAFERDLRYIYRNPFFNGEGIRWYWITKWRINRNWSFETKNSLQYLFSKDDVSNSNSSTGSQWRNDISLQIHYQF